MKSIKSINEYRQLVSSAESFLLYVKNGDNAADEWLRPKVESFEHNYELLFYDVNIQQVPGLSVPLEFTSSPMVLMFREGSEIHRFGQSAKIEELKSRLDELEEGYDV